MKTSCDFSKFRNQDSSGRGNWFSVASWRCTQLTIDRITVNQHPLQPLRFPSQFTFPWHICAPDDDSLCSRDHRTVLVGDARGRVHSWSVSDVSGRSIADHWLKDDTVECCTQCRVKFSLTERRHHCRNCGHVFCSRYESRFGHWFLDFMFNVVVLWLFAVVADSNQKSCNWEYVDRFASARAATRLWRWPPMVHLNHEPEDSESLHWKSPLQEKTHKTKKKLLDGMC